MTALWLVASLPLAPAIGIPVGLWLRRRTVALCARCDASHRPIDACPTWH